MVHPLKQFFNTKFGVGRESQFRTLTPNITVMALKIWSYSPPNRPVAKPF